MQLLYCLMLILSLMSAVNMMPSKGRFQSYLDLLQERYLQRNDDPTEMNGEFVLRNVEVAEDDQEATESLVNRLYNSFMKRDDVIPDIWHGAVQGGGGGSAFDDLDAIGQYGIYTPKSINVKSGWRVDSIQITYQTKSSAGYQGPRRGGDGGGDCKLDLGSDERIVKVEGRAGGAIDALQFTTSVGRKSASCGGGGGNYFSESRPGYVLSYISGRGGWMLDQIQFHWVREEIKYILTSVQYDLEHVRRSVQGTPKYTHTFELVNRASNDQMVSTTYTYSVSKTETWSVNAAMTVGVSTTVTAGVPDVASSSVTVSASATFGFTYGESLTVQTSQQQLVQAVVPGNSRMTGTMLVFIGEVEVPYTTELTVVYADRTQVKQGLKPGTFKGVQASKVLVEYNKPTPL